MMTTETTIESPLLPVLAPASTVRDDGRPVAKRKRRPSLRACVAAAKRLEAIEAELLSGGLSSRDRRAAVDSLRAHASLTVNHGIELLQRIAAGEYSPPAN